MDSDEARRARALARSGWQLVSHALGHDPIDQLAGSTPAQRVAMVWRLTQDAWASSGRPSPSYSRSEMPGKLIRGYGIR